MGTLRAEGGGSWIWRKRVDVAGGPVGYQMLEGRRKRSCFIGCPLTQPSPPPRGREGVASRAEGPRHEQRG